MNPKHAHPKHPEPDVTEQPEPAVTEQPAQSIAYAIPEKTVFVTRALKLLGRNANAGHTEIAELFYDFVTHHCTLTD